MKTFITTVAFLMTSVGITYAQDAELPICGDENLMELVQENYGERPVATGIMQGGAMQIWASEDGGTWTLFGILPDRICVLMIGEDFEAHGAEYIFGEPS